MSNLSKVCTYERVDDMTGDLWRRTWNTPRQAFLQICSMKVSSECPCAFTHLSLFLFTWIVFFHEYAKFAYLSLLVGRTRRKYGMVCGLAVPWSKNIHKSCTWMQNTRTIYISCLNFFRVIHFFHFCLQLTSFFSIYTCRFAQLFSIPSLTCTVPVFFP